MDNPLLVVRAFNHKYTAMERRETMNRVVYKVFALVGLLVIIFIGWQLLFNNGGILRTGYNSLVEGVNGQWEKVAGEGKTILVKWDDGSEDEKGFD